MLTLCDTKKIKLFIKKTSFTCIIETNIMNVVT